MKEYLRETGEVLKELQTDEKGLTQQEAEKRLQNGKNVLEKPKGKSLFIRFLEQLADPMILILLGAALVSGVLAVIQHDSFADVIIILAVVIANAVLGVYQENKAEAAIEALQSMSASMSKVYRDGKLVTVPSEDITVGDVIVLDAGDSVPADARILTSFSLKTEEAALTGESNAINKTSSVLVPKKGEDDITLGDRKNMVYAGSTAAYGRGEAVVTAIGMKTEMGKIASALNAAVDGETPLQRKMSQLSGILTKLVLVICVIVFGVQVIRAGSFNVNAVMNSFMVAISLAVAAIPEGLAAVVTVVLSIGVTNMAKRNAIIRHMTAVETLGCAQIICSDKTGTLTQNKMTVVRHYGEDEKEIATAFALCTDAELKEGDERSSGDPTQTAVVDYALAIGLPKYRLLEEKPQVGEIPFDSGRKMMTTVHRCGDSYIQYTTGAPDVVINRCTTVMENGKAVAFTAEKKQAVLDANKAMADDALRVLAGGCRVYDSSEIDYEPENAEKELCFLGLVGMIDPVRPEVKASIDECRSAGIRPIMITGDHVDTAKAIAKELGIFTEGNLALTGSELGKLSDEEYEAIFRDVSVYARVQPEHKTRIVNRWRNAGYVTAMTGDGVNDAPSIKSADIGIGMGITGTDVTKNVADMVLSDDNFATIVGAVEEGRRIYDNIRKTIQFLLGSNLSEVLCIFTASIIGFTIFKPVHLLWINLITDCFPALALGTERAEKNIMRRAPRSSKAGIFAEGMGIDILYQGVVISGLVLASYFIGGSTAAFITMSMAEIFHSFNMRSLRNSVFSIRHQNKLLWIAGIGSAVLTVLVTKVPVIAGVFGFETISWAVFGKAIALALAIIPIVEAVKFIERRIKR